MATALFRPLLNRFINTGFGPRPGILSPSSKPPDPGKPPKHGLEPELIAKVEESIVKVSGVACDLRQNGTGVVVGAGLIITNAHVVAGESRTSVENLSGREFVAKVVAFDPLKDVAILRVDGLVADRLALGDAKVGALAGVFGFPGGGVLEVSPARIGETIRAIGTDIYGDTKSSRSVVVLGARLEPGDSGSAVVDEEGHLVAVAFAIDPGSNTIAYALAREEIEAAIDAATNANSSSVDAGDCIEYK